MQSRKENLKVLNSLKEMANDHPEVCDISANKVEGLSDTMIEMYSLIESVVDVIEYIEKDLKLSTGVAERMHSVIG